MKLADLKWAAGVFVSAALRPAGHDNCECHPRLGYGGPREAAPGVAQKETREIDHLAGHRERRNSD